MAAPDGDKRWTAILSTDMADFTRISGEIGAEEMYALLDHVLGLARTSIEAHGGKVVDTAGDGILAAFGAPNALENASLQACRAAMSFRDALEKDTDALTARFGVTPLFRTGIAGGVSMIAHEGNGTIKVVGPSVNTAARLQSLASPNEVLLSENIQLEIEGTARTEDRGPTDVKGFDDPLHIHRLIGIIEHVTKFDSARRRGIVDLVSRENELGAALEALDTPALMAIIGAPGIGKSRLVHEVATALPEERPVYLGQCAPTGLTPAYGPVLSILRQAGGSPIDANRHTILTNLFARHPGLEDAHAAERFLEPETSERDQTKRAMGNRAFLLDLLRGLATEENCVFVIEDVHWIDTATNGLLSALGTHPVPVLVTSRPEFRADWYDYASTRHINLMPLGQADIRRIVEANLSAGISERLATLISTKAEGNPLMAEEITRALRQSNRLIENNDFLDIADDDEGTLLTGNLEQLVLARVDRLAPDQKTTLQYAATIGRDFPEDLLTETLDRSPDLAAIAEIPGLIEEFAPEQWRFAHALIRDAVYGSMLTSQRQTAHLKIAQAIENSSSAYANNWSALAEHYLNTGSPEKSAPALIRAAQQSLAVYALYEVDHRLDQAMGFLETDPDLVDDESYSNLVMSWLRALDQIGDFGRVQKISARVLPRLERQGYSPALGIARTLTAISMTHSRDYRGAEDLALKALADAEAASDALGAAWAKVALMRTYEETAWQGLETLERLASEIKPVAEQYADHHLAMSALYLLSSGHRSQGSQRTALSISDEINEFSARHDDRRARTYALWSRAIVFAVQGNPEEAYRIVKPASDDVIPGSGDERVFNGILRFSETFMFPPEDVRPKLVQLIAEARKMRDFNLAHSVEWIRVILELRASNLATAWGLLDDLIEDTERKGHIPILRQNYLTRGELRMSLLGLIDPASEAPPDRPKPVKKRPSPRDLMAYGSIRIGARAKAEKDLLKALSLSRSLHGGHVARCQVGLGLIALSRGKKAEARKHIEDGLKTIEGEDFDIIEKRARNALKMLA